MKNLLIVVVGAASLLGCGARSIKTGEESLSLTGYLYSPRSSLCMTQASDPTLPDLEAALDTIISDKPASELLAGGFDELCGSAGAAPITSFKLLQAVSNIGCTRSNISGCLEGTSKYTVTGAFEQAEICSAVTKDEPPACRVGEVFVPTRVTRE